MLYKIIKNAISNYPSPMIACNVSCYLTEEAKTNDNACYWIPFQVSLTECIDKTQEQIDEMIKVKGEELFNAPEMKVIYQAIEVGAGISTPTEIK
jgi:hypothetical protein